MLCKNTITGLEDFERNLSANSWRLMIRYLNMAEHHPLAIMPLPILYPRGILKTYKKCRAGVLLIYDYIYDLVHTNFLQFYRHYFVWKKHSQMKHVCAQ